MLKNIISTVSEKLTEAGASHVYSAFDAVDICRKPDSIFTVVGIDSFSSTSPVLSMYHVYIPFRAEVSLKVTAPQSWSMDKLLDYFDSYIGPAVLGMSGLDCKLKGIAIKPDSGINRLVLTAVISAGGIIKSERSQS